jgi:hypothetical protein
MNLIIQLLGEGHSNSRAKSRTPRRSGSSTSRKVVQAIQDLDGTKRGICELWLSLEKSEREAWVELTHTLAYNTRQHRIDEERVFQSPYTDPSKNPSAFELAEKKHDARNDRAVKVYKRTVARVGEFYVTQAMGLVEFAKSKGDEDSRFFCPRKCPDLESTMLLDKALALLYRGYLLRIYESELAPNYSTIAFNLDGLDKVVSVLEEFSDVEKVFAFRQRQLESQLSGVIDQYAHLDKDDRGDTLSYITARAHEQRKKPSATGTSQTSLGQSSASASKTKTMSAPELYDAWFTREGSEARSVKLTRLTSEVKQQAIKVLIEDNREKFMALAKNLDIFSGGLLVFVQKKMVMPGADIGAFFAIQTRLNSFMEGQKRQFFFESESVKKRVRDSDSPVAGPSTKRHDTG